MSLIMRFLLLSLCAIQLTSCVRTEQQQPKTATPSDPSKDPQYATYIFGKEPKKIDIGTQPLALPESPVGELLARDRVLSAQLAAVGASHTTHPFHKGADINFFLSRGDLEAGIAGDMPAITSAATGDIVIVGMVKQGFSSIIARQPMMTKDLKGKRIATALGSTAHFTLLNALTNEGLEEKDVTIVAMETRDMPVALSEKKIDAFCAWEPTPTIALSSNQGFHLVHRGINMSFLYFRKDFAATNPELVRQVAAATARACFWMRKPGNLDIAAGWSMDAASRFQGKPYVLETPRVVTIISNDLLHIPNAPQIDERMLKENELLWREFNFLKKSGKISTTVAWDRVRSSFNTDIMRQVLADEKRYALDHFDYKQSAAPVREVSQ